MCGILGIVGEGGLEANQSRVGAMLNYLQARGPDDCGIVSFPNCLLAHTRLSIIDLSTGNQPMTDNARNIVITFNGEIYNHQELRSELADRGHSFSTRSDTEVILKAFIEYGPLCVTHFDGMFAFAIWDQDRNSLFLARDRFGKKPLYYAFSAEGDLVFASEIKAILASGMVSAQIDHLAIHQYLQLLYIPPTKTAFATIDTLKPAHTGVFERGKLSTERYWSLKREPLRISYGDAKEELRERLRQAVKKRLVADVEIGTLLSGGVDSTLITLYAQAQSDRPIKSFSVGYGKHINELPFALQAATKIGTDHHTLELDPDPASELMKVAEYFDEPHGDTSNVAQHLVSRLARSKVKVALCGDGGDELFHGYPWYLDHQGKSFTGSLLNKLLADPFAAYLDRIQVFRSEELDSLWTERPLWNIRACKEWNDTRIAPYKRINHFDLTVYLPGQLLTKADRAGMMNSLEVRSPFLDHSLTEFVYNLPERYKTDRRTGKIILKDLLAETMPTEFVNRRKQGFGAPVYQWLRDGSLKTLVHDLFLGSAASVYDFLKPKAVRALIDRFYLEGLNNLSYRIWSLLCLELWLKSLRRVRLRESYSPALLEATRSVYKREAV